MIVDDEPDIRKTVKIILKAYGYKVVTAVNGDDCLKKLPKQKIDLILLDIMMPGMPVKEVVKKIKEVKIVYLSVVRISKAEKKSLISKNIVEFIEKPFEISDLVKKVKEIVGD
jgi:two-component system KDP operon response regulator KdpE